MPLSTRSDVVPLDSSEVEGLVTGVRINRYFQVAVATLLVYDSSKQLNQHADIFSDVAQS